MCEVKTSESFKSVLNRFKGLESWLNDEAHESPEHHHYLTELRAALTALSARDGLRGMYEFTLNENSKLRDDIAIMNKQNAFLKREVENLNGALLALKSTDQGAILTASAPASYNGYSVVVGNVPLQVPQCNICDPGWASRTLAPTIPSDTICDCGVETRYKLHEDGSRSIQYFRGDKQISPFK